MRHLALASLIGIATATLVGCGKAEYKSVQAPGKPGNYVQVYERDGMQWLEVIQVDDKGEAKRASGTLPQRLDLSEPLPLVNVTFEHCGLGTFAQPQVSLGKVMFHGFVNSEDGCEIHNPPSDFDRLDTRVH